MKILHEVGQKIEVVGEDGEVAFAYVYGQELAPKPFVYPVGIPNAGNFGALRPTDHMWHRGLWFTWKFVNDANYWEEGQEPEGHQHTVRAPEVGVEGFGEALTITSALDWKDRGETRLREERSIRFSPEGDSARMDWEIRQTMLQDLLLDRTPFTTWGGYGGLVLRATQSLRNGALLFPDGSTADFIAGDPHRWCDMTGQMDGAPNLYGGITFFDHPVNPRHPTPFYARTRPLDSFMNAALLFHEPMRLKEGDTLHLRYRVMMHHGKRSVDELNDAWKTYAGESV